ncbi:MAG: DUF6442 family protein [Eubacteriales bacterium]|nr:DUF6442 family protein [Eubacteriales bacterium]
MERFKDWLLPAEDDMEKEITASLIGELALIGTFMSVAICNAVKGKDNRPLLVVILGFLSGKWIGRFLETREKKDLLLSVLNLLSGVLYTLSCLLDNQEK